jgi:hypothetical protein
MLQIPADELAQLDSRRKDKQNPSKQSSCETITSDARITRAKPELEGPEHLDQSSNSKIAWHPLCQEKMRATPELAIRGKTPPA